MTYCIFVHIVIKLLLNRVRRCYWKLMQI